MGNPVMFFEIVGKNAEKLREFYSTLFDWTILPFGWKIPHFPNDIYGVDPTPPPLPDNGIKGHIFPLSDEMDFSNRVTIFIQVDDLEETFKKIENHGGKTLVSPQVLPENMGSIAMFVDPSRNVVGLYQL